MIRVRATETRCKKDGRWCFEIKDFPKTRAGRRNVVLPKAFYRVRDELQKINPPESREFVFERDGIRLRANCIRQRLRRVCQKLGIPPRGAHVIRKTYCSMLLDCGLDNRFITNQVGHVDIACTEGYYHRERKSVARQIDMISSIPEFDAFVTKSDQIEPSAGVRS